MRTETEMMDLILSTAREDARVRAVYLNGSRANPNVAKDAWRDYDVVFVVTETASFLADKSWIRVFGDIAMVQEPDSNDLGWGINHDFSRSYAWLILFKDFNRIDLSIQTVAAALEDYSGDTLTVPLLDKDHLLPAIPAANDSGYWERKPSKAQFDGCCNEFWWCLNNVAKGIARDQLSYAMRMYTQIVHIELEHMLAWMIGARTDFSLTVGMWGKYFKKYLPGPVYAAYTRTYSAGGLEPLWEAVFAACALFSETAAEVGDRLGYAYNKHDEENMLVYLRAMREETVSGAQIDAG